MKQFVTCGTMKVSVGFSDIVCDPSTGDLIFCDDVMGNCVMSNLTIVDPIDVDGSPAVDKILADTKVDGVIMSESYLILLKDGVAEYRDYSNATRIVHTVNFDLDIEYEGEIN